MNLGMDVDGVFADFGIGFLELAKKLFPNKKVDIVGIGGLRQWGFSQFYTKEEEKRIWDEIRSSGRFWMDQPRCFTTADQRTMFRFAEKHKIYYLTGRSGKDALLQTQTWLHQHGLPSSENVFLTGDDKGKFCLKNSPHIDIMIDDSVEQIKKMRDVGISTWVRDWPYNRSLGPEYRVNSLAEYEWYINRIDAGEQITYLNGVEVDQWLNPLSVS